MQPFQKIKASSSREVGLCFENYFVLTYINLSVQLEPSSFSKVNLMNNEET